MALKLLIMQAGGGDSAISYSALDARALFDALIAGEGVIGAGLKVSQRGAGANFSVDVAVGYAAILGDDVSLQGKYLVQNTAVANLVIASPPVSGTRIHRVIARIKDKLHNGTWTTYEWILEVLADTGSGTPALPASAINLATVSVAAGQANVSNANITDLRVSAMGLYSRPAQVASDAGRPQQPLAFERLARTDKGYEEWWNATTSAWVVDDARPTIVTAVDTDAGTTTSTSFTTTLTGAAANVSVAFTAPASGKALVRALAFMKTDTAGLDMYFGARITVTSGGATFYTPTDQECAKSDPDRFVTCMNEYIVTGLTPGTSYTAVGVHKVQAGGTVGNYDDRRITVQPI